MSPWHCIPAAAAIAVAASTACLPGAGAHPASLRVAGLLETGEQPVRIACFGDSITGVYYHSGGERAWCDMLGIALQRLYPKARLEMVNAGVSGHATDAALARIDGDVLQRSPQLVVVSFGMNDVTRIPIETFRANLTQIVDKCRGVGAEVVLCTPTSVYPGEDANRPMDRLDAYSDVIRELGKSLGVPVADMFATYEDIRAHDRRAWMLMMSEIIHPNMRGHKVMAEEIAWVISGRRVSVQDVRAAQPYIPRTLGLLAQHAAVKVVAMPPYDELIGPALRQLHPEAEVNVTSWPVAGQSIEDIEKWAQSVRPLAPDLVIVAVPASVVADSDEHFIRSYAETLNWSLGYVQRTWDHLTILPSVAGGSLNHGEVADEAFALQVIQGQDTPYLQRAEGDGRPPMDLLVEWLRAQRQ